MGWFNALSAFRPTFNLMASAGRSSTGNNDFFFWFQLQKCPCCVIYWCFQKLKHSDAWIEVSSVLSFLAHCVKKLKINLLVILLSFDWRTDSWWDVFQWFVPITRPLSVSFLLFTFFLGHNRCSICAYFLVVKLARLLIARSSIQWTPLRQFLLSPLL